jgi:hypothetical protein
MEIKMRLKAKRALLTLQANVCLVEDISGMFPPAAEIQS